MATRAFASSFDVDGVRTVTTFATFAEARADHERKFSAWQATLHEPSDVDGAIYADDGESYESDCSVQQTVNGRTRLVYGFFSIKAIDVPAGVSAATVANALPRDGVAIELPAGFLNGIFGTGNGGAAGSA